MERDIWACLKLVGKALLAIKFGPSPINKLKGQACMHACSHGESNDFEVKHMCELICSLSKSNNVDNGEREAQWDVMLRALSAVEMGRSCCLCPPKASNPIYIYDSILVCFDLMCLIILWCMYLDVRIGFVVIKKGKYLYQQMRENNFWKYFSKTTLIIFKIDITSENLYISLLDLFSYI